MSSKFGRGPFGRGIYSRDFTTGGVAAARAGSFVAASAQVRHAALINIEAAASVDAGGRLLWEHIYPAPCEGAWTPLVDSPCSRAA
jgi:hypothetical protein